jgi:hypothetical protein
VAVRARQGSAVSFASPIEITHPISILLLCGRAARSTDRFGGARPGQML